MSIVIMAESGVCLSKDGIDGSFIPSGDSLSRQSLFQKDTNILFSVAMLALKMAPNLQRSVFDPYARS